MIILILISILILFLLWIIIGNLYYSIILKKFRADIYFGVHDSGITAHESYLTKKTLKKNLKGNKIL